MFVVLVGMLWVKKFRRLGQRDQQHDQRFGRAKILLRPKRLESEVPNVGGKQKAKSKICNWKSRDWLRLLSLYLQVWVHWHFLWSHLSEIFAHQFYRHYARHFRSEYIIAKCCQQTWSLLFGPSVFKNLSSFEF